MAYTSFADLRLLRGTDSQPFSGNHMEPSFINRNYRRTREWWVDLSVNEKSWAELLGQGWSVSNELGARDHSCGIFWAGMLFTTHASSSAAISVIWLQGVTVFMCVGWNADSESMPRQWVFHLVLFSIFTLYQALTDTVWRLETKTCTGTACGLMSQHSNKS